LQHGLWRASARRPCLTAWRLPGTTGLGLRPSMASSVGDAGTLKRLKKVRKRIKRFNKTREIRPPLPEHTMAMLNEYYRSDVDKLSALLGRDLTYWLRPPDEVNPEV